MALDPKVAPTFEVDQLGNLTHINGTALPEGLVYASISPSIAAAAPLVGSEWTIDAAYANARRLRGVRESGD